MPAELRECRLVPGRPAAAQAQALATDLVAHAAAQAGAADPAEAVHQVRLVLKALRALVRLVPDPRTGRPPTKVERPLQSLGRRLSPTRDLDVATATLAALAAEHGGPRHRAAARRWIRSTRPAPTARATAAVGVALRRLQPALLRHLAAHARGPAIARGLERALRKAERWQARAAKDGRVEAFHAWRRWLKRLETQLRWTHPRASRPVRRIHDRLADLQEDLGRLHDLDVLAELLGAGDGRGPAAADARLLLPLVAERGSRLRARVLRRGRDLPSGRLHRLVRALRRGRSRARAR